MLEQWEDVDQSGGCRRSGRRWVSLVGVGVVVEVGQSGGCRSSGEGGSVWRVLEQ